MKMTKKGSEKKRVEDEITLFWAVIYLTAAALDKKSFSKK